MKTLILDGHPNKDDANYYNFLNDWRPEGTTQCEIEIITIRDQNIKYCKGCWDCWWKTPGICSIKDDMRELLPRILHSNLVVLASPLVRGMVSKEMKKVNDRMIPLLHPYIEFVNNECHHRKRYENYPKLGMIIQKEHDTDAEDLQIVNDIYERFSLNFRTTLEFVKVVEL